MGRGRRDVGGEVVVEIAGRKVSERGFGQTRETKVFLVHIFDCFFFCEQQKSMKFFTERRKTKLTAISAALSGSE